MELDVANHAGCLHGCNDDLQVIIAGVFTLTDMLP